MTAQEFHSRFLRLIALTWVLPPMVGFAFLLYIKFFTFEQLMPMMSSPLMLGFVISGVVLSLLYFHHYARPLNTFLCGHEIDNIVVEKTLRRFSLHYWLAFLLYILAAPAVTVISLEMTSDYIAQPIDWFRIHLIALIVSIIVGLPIFVSTYDLFGKAFAQVRLQRPIVTIKTRVFLLGALIPLLIDTMLVQYYWTRTGFFSAETFIIWLLLECLAIVGALMFVRSFSQSLAPLERLIDEPVDSLDSKVLPASTDELGIFAAQLAELLDKQQLNQHRLAFSNELLKALHNHENLENLLQTVVDRTCQMLTDDACFLSLYDSNKDKLICVARSNAEYKPQGYFQIAMNETSIHVSVFKSGKVQVINDALHDQRAHARLRTSYDVKSSAAAPLIIKDKVIGVLHVASIQKQHHYTQHELEILQAFAREAALIQAFFEDLKHQRTTETAITQIMLGVSTTTGEDFFRAIIGQLSHMLQADACGVFTLVPGESDVVKSLAYFINDKIALNIKYPLQGTLCETVIG